jgi:hypothetical protein
VAWTAIPAGQGDLRGRLIAGQKPHRNAAVA